MTKKEEEKKKKEERRGGRRGRTKKPNGGKENKRRNKSEGSIVETGEKKGRTLTSVHYNEFYFFNFYRLKSR